MQLVPWFLTFQHFDPLAFQKGFGEEEPGIQQELEKFFNGYGRTNAVRMRRIDGTKAFKVRHRELPSEKAKPNLLIGLRLRGIC
jgi:hypothetical protein